MTFLDQWPKEFSEKEIAVAAKAASRHQPDNAFERDDFWQYVRIKIWKAFEREKPTEPGRRLAIMWSQAQWAAQDFWSDQNFKRMDGGKVHRQEITVRDYRPNSGTEYDRPDSFWNSVPDTDGEEPKFSKGMLRLFALAKLTDKQARAIELHYCSGASIPVVAGLMGIDQKSAQRLVDAGIKKLKEAAGQKS
jgi:RNA polymerase sigma factor (sigma-70 family)